jgi:hypothetical protein
MNQFAGNLKPGNFQNLAEVLILYLSRYGDHPWVVTLCSRVRLGNHGLAANPRFLAYALK